MAKNPAFPFYAADFLVDTLRWSRDMKSLHIDLLCESWVNGVIADDGGAPAGLDNDDRRTWQKIAHKWQLADGRWYNEKMEEVRGRHTAFVEKQRENGARGGRPKKEKKEVDIIGGENKPETQAFPVKNPSLFLGFDVSGKNAASDFDEKNPPAKKESVFLEGKNGFLEKGIENQYFEKKEKPKPFENENPNETQTKAKPFENKTQTKPKQKPCEHEHEKEYLEDNIGGMGGKEETFEFPKYPSESDVGLELPATRIGAAVELIYFTKNKTKVTPEQVKGLWRVFQVQNFTGNKYYHDTGAVYSHFFNWLKTQNIQNGNLTTHSGTATNRNRQTAASAAVTDDLATALGMLHGSGYSA